MDQKENKSEFEKSPSNDSASSLDNNNSNPSKIQPQNGQNKDRSQNRNQSQRRRRPNQKNQRSHQPQTGNRNANQASQKNGESKNNVRSDNNQRNSTTGPWGMNPLPTQTGIQTRSQRGEFAKNWWARRWLEALERLMQGVRLSRGQYYARMGQIVSLEEIKGGMLARVQGSRPKPYRVSIQLTPFNNKQWEKVFDLLSEKSIYMAKLLVGEMPQDIETVFNQAGVSLFPEHSIDLQTKCTCPDKITPCKHIAATHYILGDRFDEDPFLLFRMRGRSQDQILEALRQRRGAEADLDIDYSETPTRVSTPEVPRFPETLEHFWEVQQDLAQVNVQVRMPTIPQPLLKRLGEPEFSSQLTLQGQLEESYDLISQFAIMIAYADTSGTPTNGNGDGD
jgi:uncharacterized Zn finger protein